MKDTLTIGVLGANGKTGRVCMTRLLEEGYHVRAGVYHSNDLSAHPNVRVVSVDGTDTVQVLQWASGCDALVSLVGHTKGSPEWMQTETMKNIVTAANQLSIRRVVSLTGTGVRFDGDKISLIDHILNFAIARIDPVRIKDGIEHAEVLKKSGLDWTLLRVLKLTNGATEKYTLSPTGPASITTSRRTVAKAIAELLAQPACFKQAPIVVESRKESQR